MVKTQQKTVPFGFEEVSPSEKTARVHEVFANVASRYDLMNDVMSLGVHRLWKRTLVEQLNLRPDDRHLDLAGGTGDIAFKIVQRYSEVKVTLSDINAEMLRVGQQRSGNQGNIEWVCADATNLPFASNIYDCCTIAFGLRNITDIEAALHEAYRVLKPGSRYFCLEFSKVMLPLLDDLYQRYSFNLIPKLGKWVAKDEESYQYLVESIERFPNQEKLCQMLTGVGFQNVKHQNLSGGIVAIHSGWKT